jgi:hypothetical protein
MTVSYVSVGVKWTVAFDADGQACDGAETEPGSRLAANPGYNASIDHIRERCPLLASSRRVARPTRQPARVRVRERGSRVSSAVAVATRRGAHVRISDTLTDEAGAFA